MEWYYVVNKKKMGPVTRDDLAQRVATGDLQPQTLVWHTGASGWKPWSAFAAGSAAAGSQGTAPLPGGPTATSLKSLPRQVPKSAATLVLTLTEAKPALTEPRLFATQ